MVSLGEVLSFWKMPAIHKGSKVLIDLVLLYLFLLCCGKFLLHLSPTLDYTGKLGVGEL